MRYRKAKNKSDQVVDQIIQSVIDGEYKPGDRLPIESELAEQFGVSRITIREAIKKLSAMQLVSPLEAKGTFINRLNISNFMEPLLPLLALQEKDVHALFDTRLYLEMGIASLSAQYATAEDIKALTEIHRMMEKNFSEAGGSNPLYTFSDQKFHETLAQSSHNEVLINIYKTVQDVYRSFIEKTSNLKSGREASIKEHELILKAIKERNPIAAEDAMRKHIKKAKALYSEVIANTSKTS